MLDALCVWLPVPAQELLLAMLVEEEWFSDSKVSGARGFGVGVLRRADPVLKGSWLLGSLAPKSFEPFTPKPQLLAPEPQHI